MKARRVTLIGLLSAGLLLGAALGLADTLGRWRQAAPARYKRTEVGVATVRGKIYVIGGFRRLGVTRIMEEYDPATDQWRTRAPLPVPLHHIGVGVVQERIYVIGGFRRRFLNFWHPVNTVYAYDPETDRWSERTPMPTARGALAVGVVGDYLYAIGGYDGERNTPANEVYDPIRDRWDVKRPMPTPRDHLAVAAVEGMLYAIGGRLQLAYARNLAVNEAYDPTTDRWTRKADMPTPRSGITAAVLGERIYVLGGESPQGTFATNEEYTPMTDSWRPMAPMPTARHGLGSAVVGRQLYVLAGGPEPGGSFSDRNEVFTLDPAF
jgi:N-acetylneuraminic acid mutarotase